MVPKQELSHSKEMFDPGATPLPKKSTFNVKVTDCGPSVPAQTIYNTVTYHTTPHLTLTQTTTCHLDTHHVHTYPQTYITYTKTCIPHTHTSTYIPHTYDIHRDTQITYTIHITHSCTPCANTLTCTIHMCTRTCAHTSVGENNLKVNRFRWKLSPASGTQVRG